MNVENETAEVLEKYFQPTWQSKIAFYREWVTEWDTSAMVKLLERLSQSHYSDLFCPIVTSHDWLCISTESDLEKMPKSDCVWINYDDRRKVFHLHNQEAGTSKVEKTEYSAENDMIRAVESALLRMKMRNDASSAV